MRVVDLSHTMRTGMTVFPGDPEVSIRPSNTIEHDGFRVSHVQIGSHSGTHMDAPSHTESQGDDLSDIPLERMLGTALIVRVPDLGPREQVRLERVQSQLDSLDGESIVFFDTGWSRHFGGEMYQEHPFFEPEIARELLRRGVSVIGVDTLNPDLTPTREGDDESLPFHAAILGSGGVIIENLTNLSAVDWRRPTVIALPLSLGPLDGSPVRAVAVDGYELNDRPRKEQQ